MGQTRSVDELLNKVYNEQSEIDNPQPEPSVELQHEPEVAAAEPEVVEAQAESVTEGHDDSVSEAPKEETHTENEQSASDSAVNPIDEYGNPVEKPKTYTEEEVQRMIRDRLSRGKHAEQQSQQVQQATDDFKADPNSDDSWEVQLEQFIEKTIDKRQTKQSEREWRHQEAARQAEFESKFSSGMNKYQDFHQVIAGKPITDSMMMATRNLENPAAFVYAASKMHSGELTRISQIPDSTAQMVEIGRLHERMVKENRSVSSAPKPLAAVRGDMPVKQHEYPSIDHRIQQHAKQKFARK